MPHKRLLIVMSIFAVDIFAAFVWLFYTESPYYVLRQAQNHLSEATSVTATISVTANGNAQQFHITDFLKGTQASSSLFQTSLNARMITALDLHALGSLNSEMQVFMQIRQNLTPLSVSGAFLSRGDQRFIRFDQDPQQGIVQKNALSKWVSIPPQYLPYPFLRSDISLPLSSDREKKLRDLFRATKFLTFEKEYPESSDSGQKMFHYELRLRQDALQGFGILATNVREQRSLSDEELDGLKKTLNTYSISRVDVWVGKRDLYVHRLLLQGEYKKSEHVSGTPFTIDIVVDSWNTPVTITVPSGVLPLSDAFITHATGILGGAENISVRPSESVDIQNVGLYVEKTSSSIRESEDADRDGLSNTLETFYRTDFLNPDTDGDGFKDGYEVNNGYNPTGPGTLFGFGK